MPCWRRRGQVAPDRASRCPRREIHLGPVPTGKISNNAKTQLEVNPTFKGTWRIPKNTKASWVGIAAQKAFQFIALKSYFVSQYSKRDIGMTDKVGVELPPRLHFAANIKDPTCLSEVGQIPPADSYDNVEDAGDQEEVGWEDELMVEEMCNDT